jgi:exosortase
MATNLQYSLSRMDLHSGDKRQASVILMAYVTPVLLLVTAIYGRSLAELFLAWWTFPEHSQGLVVVPFAVFLAGLHWRSLAAIPASCELRGLLLVAAGCGMHVFGQLAAGLYISQLSFVLVLAGISFTFWGMGRFRLLVLPILLLATAIPLPSVISASLSVPLQLLASRIACSVADFAGVAVYREGNIIHLATISLGVWEACSGLTSLSALMVGSVLLGFMLCRLPVTRILVCIATVPVAIIINIARVTGTAILSDWRPAYAMGFYHAFSGWLVFLVGVAGIYGVAIGLRRLFDK